MSKKYDNIHRMVRRLSMFAAAIAVMASHGANAQEPIKIGVNTPVSGVVAVASEREMQGVNLAVEEINAAGGVLGRPLQTIVVDNRCNPSEAVNAANRLIEEKVVAIIGGHCSSATLAIMPVVKTAKIPLLGGVASSPKITELSGVGGNEWTFRSNPSDFDMMKALVSHISKSKMFTNIAVIGEDTDFGRGGAEAFASIAQGTDLKIISTDFMPQGTPDLTSILTRVSRSKPDAIAVFITGSDQVNMVRTAMQMGLTIPFTGRIELGGENMQFITAGGLEGSISAWSYSTEVDSPENKAFNAKIQEKYGLPAQLQTWAGYDNLRLIAQAIQEAGEADPVKVRDAMAKITFQTVLGPKVTFNDHNDAGKIVLIQQVKDKAITIADIVDGK